MDFKPLCRVAAFAGARGSPRASSSTAPSTSHPGGRVGWVQGSGQERGEPGYAPGLARALPLGWCQESGEAESCDVVAPPPAAEPPLQASVGDWMLAGPQPMSGAPTEGLLTIALALVPAELGRGVLVALLDSPLQGTGGRRCSAPARRASDPMRGATFAEVLPPSGAVDDLRAALLRCALHPGRPPRGLLSGALARQLLLPGALGLPGKPHP